MMLVNIYKLDEKFNINSTAFFVSKMPHQMGVPETTQIVLETHVDTINYFGRDSQHASL